MCVFCAGEFVLDELTPVYKMDKPRTPAPGPSPTSTTAASYSRGIFKPPRLPPSNRVPRFPRTLPEVGGGTSGSGISGASGNGSGGGSSGTQTAGGVVAPPPPPPPPPKFILPPISTYLPRPPPPSTTTSAVDLSVISRAKLKLPDEGAGFVMSKDLQRDLQRGVTNECPVTELLDRVYEEARSYAEKRKMLVRKQLKERLEEVGEKLSARERGKLRSRREAKVHRVKEQELEKALKSTIRWLIESAPRTDDSGGGGGGGGTGVPGGGGTNLTTTNMDITPTTMTPTMNAAPTPTTSTMTPVTTTTEQCTTYTRGDEQHQQQQVKSENTIDKNEGNATGGTSTGNASRC